MPTPKKDPLVVSLEAEISPGFEPGDASLRYVVKVLRLTEDGIRGISWSPYGDDYPELADLTVRAWAGVDWEGTYGWEVSYLGPYDVDLAHAEAMVRTLRRITRRLEALDGRPGQDYTPARSFPEYVLRVAKWLKVKQFGTWGERRPNGTRPWIELDGPAGATAWLEGQLASFREQYPIRQPASA
jgi:hypothetical protein